MHFFFAKPLALGEKWNRRKIRLIESNAKCRHLTKFTCRGTLLPVFQRLWTGDSPFLHAFSHVGNFIPALRYVLSPVAPPLLSGSTLSPPSPLPCGNKYTVFTYTECKSLYRLTFQIRNFALHSMSLIFLQMELFKEGSKKNICKTILASYLDPDLLHCLQMLLNL